MSKKNIQKLYQNNAVLTTCLTVENILVEYFKFQLLRGFLKCVMVGVGYRFYKQKFSKEISCISTNINIYSFVRDDGNKT